MKFVICLLMATTSLIAQTPHRGVVSISGSKGGKVLNRCLGFIVEKEGFVLTNYDNLTSQPDGRLLESFAVTSGSTIYGAEIIGVEPTINIAILKIESDELFTPVVSAVKREITPGMALQAVSFDGDVLKTIDGEVTALNTKLCYQHSLASTMFRAKITIPTTSLGGPVFHADSGEVAAIYTGFKPAPEPGHAEDTTETHLLPINLCFNIYESLKTKRSLKSPWTGFSVRPLNEKEQHHFPTAKKHHGGVTIEDVWENSPAQKLGIKAGDILVQFSYNRILSVADFQKWLYMYGVGHPVKLIILRNGTEYLMTDYVIEERPQWAKPK
ncbi:MAG: trypsin-like peptidase domain-containing protein [Verrucomicrobia bacterium]|nr:trypsin-like peptidase domain-containing protein [Verrucomicrobiota bacterium]